MGLQLRVARRPLKLQGEPLIDDDPQIDTD